MVDELNTVFEYLQNKIADLLDVNRNHIKIKSVSDAVYENGVSVSNITYTLDGGPKKSAVWKEYPTTDGTQCDLIRLS